MSDTSSPINTSLSSESYKSPKRLNSEEVQIPFPNPNDVTSQQHSSQYAKEDSSSSSGSTKQQAFLCPHNVHIACFCCSQYLKQRYENRSLKGFEKHHHCDSLEKEQGPEEYLGDLKEEIEKLQKKVEETTDPIKNAVQGWFDMSLQILVKISNNILQDLDQEQQKLFSHKEFNQEIIDMEGQILVLKGASTEQGNAFPEEVSFQVNVQKKMKELQRLSNSLKSPDIDDFKKRLNEILFFSEKAIERIRIPAFINVRLYQMLDIDVSTTISSMSLLSRPQGRISVP